MSTSTKVQIGAAVGILVLALTALVWGLLAHREPGLMKVCWDSKFGSANYVCLSGDELMWPRSRIPLNVSTDGMVGETQTAIDLINTQVGCELLAYSEYIPGTPTDVMIATEGAFNRSTSRGGITWHLRDEGRMRARVELYAPGDMSLRVIVHELGHALGLAHDEYKGSIMYPKQEGPANLQFIMFSQHDRDLLKSLYCE